MGEAGRRRIMGWVVRGMCGEGEEKLLNAYELSVGGEEEGER